ncbi:hypothetical protein RIF29_27704 [Crotalaria pallida]|uniref:Interactor of constitutive active ROPs 3 n=1 Tax=Crotalaria pallida TaxID=3830 RepID=A0AAN9ERR0_CROPI
MQTPKARIGSVEIPKKFLRAHTALGPAASATQLNQVNKSSKDRSPKVTERRSHRSQVPERKRPSRISELESQISQLKVDSKNLRDQLSLSESCKKQAQKDSEEYKVQLLALSVKLEDSQQQLLKLAATEEAPVTEVQKIAQEIQQLKVHLELIANCESAQIHLAESLELEILKLKQNLAEPLSLVENTKNKFMDCYESAQSKPLVNETLKQLEAAKRTVEVLRADAAKSMHGLNSNALELEHSRARVDSLEALVRKLVARLGSNKCSHCANLADDFNFEKEAERLKKGEDRKPIEAEIRSLKSEVGQLKSALENSESKYQQEQILSMVKIRNAYELIDKMKSESSQRESELKRKEADIEKLRANLMDKETELRGIVEENEKLNLKLEKIMSSKREHELKMELKRLDECMAELKVNLMDKEKTLQSISEENEMLKLEINNKSREKVVAELEATKAAECDATMKLGIVIEEANRSNQKSMRMAEKLEVAQAANSEIEAELRRVKLQSDQWRKAAEAAAAMLSAGNNNGKLTERSLSLDNSYNLPVMNNKYLTYSEDIDDDFQRKKNGNMLKKIGVLWKKPQK